MLVLHTNNILVSYITSSKSSFLICQTINSLVDVNHAEEFNSGWRKHHKPWKTSMCSITLYSDRWCLYRKRVDSLPSTIPRGGGGGRGSGSGRWVECTQTLLLPWEVEMFFLIDPRLKEKHFKDGRNKK